MSQTTLEPLVLPAAAPEKKLTAKEKKRVEELTQGLKDKLVETLKNMVSIGQDLNEMKEILGHGRFMPYVEANFDLSHRTANRFMQVALALGAHMEAVAHLSQRTLYLLASPAVSDATRQELISQLEAGQALSFQDVQAYLQQHRPAPSLPQTVSPPVSTLRIKSLSKGFHKLYAKAAEGLPAYAGKLKPAQKAELSQMRSQLLELESWLGNLLDAPAPAPKKRGRKKRA